MPVYTDLNDTNVDGIASSAFQGRFIGEVSQMPAPSAEFEGRILLYTGSSSAFVKYAYYVCQQSNGTWSWVRQNLAPPYTLQPLKAVVSDASGELVSSEITSSELNTLAGMNANIRDTFDTKEDTVDGAAMTITHEKLLPSKVVITDGNGNISQSIVTSGELTALRGLKNPIQTQLDEKVDKTTMINGHEIQNGIDLTADDVGAMPAGTEIPSKVSELVNDSGYVTADTSDLKNYYLKDDVYTKGEVNRMVVMVPELQYKAVDALPATGDSGYIYVIPVETGYCELHIWSEDGWVYLGTTMVEPDVSQDALGIYINGIALQMASDETTGLMMSQYVQELKEAYNGFWTGGNGYVDSAGLHLTFEKRNGETVTMPDISLDVTQRTMSIESEFDNTWDDVVSFAGGSYTALKDFDVRVVSPGRYGEVNTMISTIHIQKGSYACIGSQDIVFSNAESNSRVGVRVLFQHDGAIKVFDANGIEVEALSFSNEVSSENRVYTIITKTIVVQ